MDKDNLKIPFEEQFGGTVIGEPPFTGNGFTKSTNGQIVPEYVIPVGKKIKIQDGAELWEIGKLRIG